MTTTGLQQTRRRGSAYLLIVAVSMLVSIMGLSAIALTRLSARVSDTAADFSEAGVLALAAVDHALQTIHDNPTWQDDFESEVRVFQYPYGDGTFSWLYVGQTEDGNDPGECTATVRLYGIGQVGQVARSYSVLLQAGGIPLEVLGTALHAGSDVYVNSSKAITVIGAPLSSNGLFHNDGTVFGDVEAVSQAHPSTVTGTVTIPSPPKAMPDAGVLALYIDLATEIPFTGAIEKKVLSPGYNPWGATNPDGVYVVDTGGSDLQIRYSRIHGTLIVILGSGKLFLEDAMLLHNYRADYPALIVDGDVELRLKSDMYGLSESARGTNYNPAGAPYEDNSDGDMADVYPNEIRGLVYGTGNLTLWETTRVRGTVICKWQATCEDHTEIVYDPALLTNPPPGFTSGCRTTVLAGSWQWEAPP